ncbi:MAG: fatty acid desaturase, partial [Myxococcota bacterium]
TRHHFGGRLFGFGLKGGARRWGDRLDGLSAPLFDVLDEMLFVTPKQWVRQHQASHHVFTNGEGDYDVSKPYPLLRLHRRLTRRWFHRFQTFYAPVAFVCNGFSFPVENAFDKGGRARYLLAHYGLLVVLPAWIHGWGPALLGYAAVLGGAGLVVSYFFQVSHNFSSATQSSFERDGSFEAWVRGQVAESQSFGGYALTLIMGGINLQTEHHIFPAVDPLALRRLRPALIEICVSYNMRYNEQRSTLAAVRAYHRYLWQLGREESPTHA